MSGIAYTALGGVIMSGIVGFAAYGQGKKIERGEWQTANVETLVGANEGLAKHIEKLGEQQNENQNRDVDTGNAISRVETRIIEKIVEVPVEKVIRINSDCSIDYGIVGLRNDWAKGDSLGNASRANEGSDLSLDSIEEVSREIIGNQSYPQ